MMGVMQPLPAHAGFGPSGSATTTAPPNVKSIGTTASKAKKKAAATAASNNNSNSFEFNGKKLKILIDSALDTQQLDEFSEQVDVLVDQLRDSVVSFGDNFQISQEDIEQYNAEREERLQQREEQERQLLQAQTLQQQIKKQKLLLAKLQQQPYWFNYCAAFVGSAISTLIMHPLDTIKTRLQVGGALDDDDDDDDDENENEVFGGMTNGSSGGATAVVLPFTASSTTATATTAVDTNTDDRNAGLYTDLYEGLTGNLFKEVPPSALYLGVYETVKYALVPKVAPAYLLFVYLIAGAAGETVGSVVRAPAEAVKSLVQSKAKRNAIEAFDSVAFTQEGRANVVRAWSSSVFRDVPFGAIQLAAFEVIKASILNNPNIEFDSSTLYSEAIIGAFAGGLGAFLTNPADVLTTRIITQDTDASSSEPLGVIKMGQKIYDEEGLGAFFTGWTARVGYWAPAISIFLTCYCSVRQAGIRYDLFS
mmetsp:Transcript_11663/g.12525  ORF Transcript_11663/g.12525 Transcript_11663/m.12525 type:complete len:479 (+) Transcript_11663:1-1437(+)